MPEICKRCDGYGVIVPVGSSVTAKCPDCDGRYRTNAEVKEAKRDEVAQLKRDAGYLDPNPTRPERYA